MVPRRINIVAVQLFLSAFVTAWFHGIRRGEIKNKRRESNSAIAINQDARRVPLVNSRKAREIARGIIRRGGWSISEERVRAKDNGYSRSGDSILCPSRREESNCSSTKWSVALGRMKWFTLRRYAIARGDYLTPLVRVIHTKPNTRARVTWSLDLLGV